MYGENVEKVDAIWHILFIFSVKFSIKLVNFHVKMHYSKT